jgi:hypothetical protein
LKNRQGNSRKIFAGQIGEKTKMERHPPWLRDQKAGNQQGFNIQQQLGLQQMVGFQQNPSLFNQAVLQQQQSLLQQIPVSFLGIFLDFEGLLVKNL